MRRVRIVFLGRGSALRLLSAPVGPLRHRRRIRLQQIARQRRLELPRDSHRHLANMADISGWPQKEKRSLRAIEASGQQNAAPHRFMVLIPRARRTPRPRR